MKRIVFSVLVSVFCYMPGWAQYTLTSLDFPGANLTRTFGLNNRGQIVGSARVTPPRHAFILSGGAYSFLAPAGALGTDLSEARGINDGDAVVGDLNDDTGSHGFLLSGGTLTTFDEPNAPGTTTATDISDTGVIVGYFVDNAGVFHGFVLKNGVFTQLDFPGALSMRRVRLSAVGIRTPTLSGMVFSFRRRARTVLSTRPTPHLAAPRLLASTMLA